MTRLTEHSNLTHLVWKSPLYPANATSIHNRKISLTAFRQAIKITSFFPSIALICVAFATPMSLLSPPFHDCTLKIAGIQDAMSNKLAKQLLFLEWYLCPRWPMWLLPHKRADKQERKGRILSKKASAYSSPIWQLHSTWYTFIWILMPCLQPITATPTYCTPNLWHIYDLHTQNTSGGNLGYWSRNYSFPP